MKGLILSGGKGTRLRPLTHTRAKQLVPIANKANLDYAVEDLVRAGITDIGVVISPETGEEVQRHLEQGQFGPKVQFSFILQDRPGGLAHAVKIARDYLRDEAFVMYLGDNLLDGGISHLLEPYRAGGVDACILLTRVPNPSSFGVAVKENGRIVRLVEKPKEFISDLALVGVYLFTPRIHEIIAVLKPSPRGELEITEAIQQLLEAGGNVHAEEVRGYWKDTGKPDDLLDANRLVLSRIDRNIEGTVEDSEIVGEVEIQAGAVVRHSRLRGPISIAANAVIEDSYIGPYTSIGEHARVIGSEVEYSILMRGAKLEHLPQRLDSSILGEEAEVRGEPSRRNTVQFFLGDRSTVKL